MNQSRQLVPTPLGRRRWPAEAIEVFEPSVVLHRDVLSDENPGTGYTLLFYAVALQDVGRLEEAERSFLGSHASFLEPLGPDHFMVYRLAGNLAEHYETRGLTGQAEHWRALVPSSNSGASK